MEEARERMKIVEEGRGPKVPRSQDSKVKGSQGPGYLKLTFKYELDSKEGLSCCQLKLKSLDFRTSDFRFGLSV